MRDRAGGRVGSGDRSAHADARHLAHWSARCSLL